MDRQNSQSSGADGPPPLPTWLQCGLGSGLGSGSGPGLSPGLGPGFGPGFGPGYGPGPAWFPSHGSGQSAVLSDFLSTALNHSDVSKGFPALYTSPPHPRSEGVSGGGARGTPFV